MAILSILVWYKYLSSHWTKNFLHTFQGKNVVVVEQKKKKQKARTEKKKLSFLKTHSLNGPRQYD